MSKPETITKHLHYGTIIGYANGEQIQVWDGAHWIDVAFPTFLTDIEYRIKPKEIKYTPHWPAIIDHPLRLSPRLFKTKEEAVKVYRHTIRLATEYSAILLPEEKEPILEYYGPGWPSR